MKYHLSDHSYILLTILFGAYGQIVLKWRMGRHGSLPSAISDRLGFLLRLILDPYIFSAFVAAFLASLAWMAAMTKFELGYAYPFTSLNFVIVALLSAWILMEPITWPVLPAFL